MLLTLKAWEFGQLDLSGEERSVFDKDDWEEEHRQGVSIVLSAAGVWVFRRYL